MMPGLRSRKASNLLFLALNNNFKHNNNNYAFLKRHKSNVNDLLIGATSPQETWFGPRYFSNR